MNLVDLHKAFLTAVPEGVQKSSAESAFAFQHMGELGEYRRMNSPIRAYKALVAYSHNPFIANVTRSIMSMRFKGGTI